MVKQSKLVEFLTQRAKNAAERAEHMAKKASRDPKQVADLRYEADCLDTARQVVAEAEEWDVSRDARVGAATKLKRKAKEDALAAKDKPGPKASSFVPRPEVA